MYKQYASTWTRAPQIGIFHKNVDIFSNRGPSKIYCAVYRAPKYDPNNRCCTFISNGHYVLLRIPWSYGKAIEFRIMNLALVAFTYILPITVTLFMSSCSFIKIDTPSAITETVCLFGTNVTPLSPRSCRQNRGLEARVYRIIFKGQPCRIEHLIGKDTALCPFIWTV